MDILKSKNIVRVGDITLKGKNVTSKKYVKYGRNLGFEWDDNIDKTLISKELSIVYFIVVDSNIYKIGMTMGKGGIKSCMDFYLSAGNDDPGYNRFTINWLIRDVLKKGKKVEVYMLYEEPITLTTKTIFTEKESKILIDAKVIERDCKDEYKNIYGNYPKWNFQERGETIDKQISDEFSEYKYNRKNIIL